MRTPRPRPAAFWPVLIATLIGAATPSGAAAQGAPPAGWSLVPLLGFGTVRVNDSWNSGGMEAALELEYGGAAWRASSSASLKGLGVGCSESCFEGGPALALSGSRSLGRLWIGVGAGT